MRALKISQQSIERAKTTAKDTASAAVTKVTGETHPLLLFKSFPPFSLQPPSFSSPLLPSLLPSFPSLPPSPFLPLPLFPPSQVKERDQSDKRIHITMSLDAPKISIPTSPYDTSGSTLVANLGSLNINNTFSTQDSISFETFVIKLSSIELYRLLRIISIIIINPFFPQE